MAKKGDYVRIRREIVPAGERDASVPADTAATPLVMWVKGYAQNDAHIGEECSVITRVGRAEYGTLIEETPCYELNFGVFVPEILKIDDQLRKALFGGDK